MYTAVDDTFRISVRNLVEFMCASGDIDNRDVSVPDVRVMQEGARIHRNIQHSMGSSYHAEVLLRQEIPLTSDKGFDYVLKLEGRADGIIADIDEDDDGNRIPVSDVTIDEIKTMQADVTKLKEPVYVHKAQALVYGYIYLNRYKLEHINIQMTYCNPETEKIVRFTEEYDKNRINSWFEQLVGDFKRWMDYVFDERIIRNESIHKLSFPFEYRAGQKNLVASVYKTIEQGQKLYIQAPTGVGKTISTVYPSVQACGRGLADKIFYLTSKTITRTVAEETYSILRDKGLHFTTVTLTAKDKICHMDERNCNPDVCEYAKGHFDRINDAVYDIITHESVIDREKVLEYSVKHKVCPFEMSLDVSYWCDGIICDYNYLFDPDASLKRYFSDGAKGDYIFLVDEAHNLVDRARQMYSATLVKEDFLKCKNLVKDIDKRLASSLEKCNKYMLSLKRMCDKEYIIVDNCGTFPASLSTCFSYMQKFLDKHKKNPVCDEMMDFFFKVRHFLNMYDCADDKYVTYAELDKDGDMLLHLYCVDPSENISLRLSQGKASVMFSATFLPVNYFKEMISGDISDYAVYAHSPFDTSNKRVIVGRDVSSRYTRRNINEYTKIADYIRKMVTSRHGRYMIFFPSYSYMQSVYDIYIKKYENTILELSAALNDENINDENTAKKGQEQQREQQKEQPEKQEEKEQQKEYEGKAVYNIIKQPSNMKEADKESFLSLFMENEKTDIAGFCVLGGIFSEGIDLRGDALIGVAVVGTGIPMVCRQRNILRDYFDSHGKNGYQYAYVYPGMNKVLQAAGRVIRTDNDKGIILLLDDRFLTKEYELQYPREWDKIYPCDAGCVSEYIDDFWKGMTADD